MMSPPSRIHHADRRNPLTPPAKPKSDSPVPQARALLGDRGYDADWLRNAVIDIGISPCIPSRISRKVPIPHDADLYRLRRRIESMFARLKDWRRIATRYDRCQILFLSACALAETLIYWL